MPNKNQNKNTNIEHIQSTSVSRIMTIPNILSFIRIILITPFVNFFLDGEYLSAACVIILSGLSDCVDGFIARAFHQESELGKILDPLADKLTLVAVGACLIVVQPYVLPIMVVLVIKDIFMIIGGSIIIKKGILVPKSKWYGKLGTILFYITVTFIVLVKVMSEMEKPLICMLPQLSLTISIALMALTTVVMVYSLIRYSFIFRDILKSTKKADFNENNIK